MGSCRFQGRVEGKKPLTPQNHPLAGLELRVGERAVGAQRLQTLELADDVIVDAAPGALKQLLEAYTEVGGNLIGVEAVPDSETHKYGIVEPVSRDGRRIGIKGMIEKPPKGMAPSNLSISGRYILQPEIFDILATQERGAGSEIQLTDAMATLMKSQAFTAVEYEGVTHDCGDKIGLLRANVALALKREDLGAGARAALQGYFS